MPFRLREEFPEAIGGEYWYHDSGGAHAMDHLADIPDVNTLRNRFGLEPFKEGAMGKRLYAGGVEVVRKIAGDEVQGDADGIAGYLVADVNRHGGRLDVHDLWVDEAHHRKGIGGFLLGNLISQVPSTYNGVEQRWNYGSVLILRDKGEDRDNDKELQLPGVKRQVDADRFSTTESLDQFVNYHLREDYRGILDVRSDDPAERTWIVFDEGQHRADMQAVGFGTVGIVGKAGEYEGDQFAAMAVLNPDSELFHA